MDPVSERPVAVDGKTHYAKRFDHGKSHDKEAAPAASGTEATSRVYPCPAPGCTRKFASERAMQTHYGRIHKKHHARQSREAADKGSTARNL